MFKHLRQMILVLTGVLLPVFVAAAAGATAAAPAILHIGATKPDLRDWNDFKYAESFARRMSLRDNYEAVPVMVGAWYTPPEDRYPYIGLVRVAFDAHHEYFAFAFARVSGRATMVCRVQAVDRVVNYWYMVAPGDGQVPRNAMVDLIGQLAHAWPEPSRHVTGPAVQVEVKIRNNRDNGGGAGLTSQPAGIGGFAGADVNSLSSGRKASAADVNKVLPFAMAGALAAGFSPGLHEAENRITLEISATVAGFDIWLTGHFQNQEPRQLSAPDVRAENMYNQLCSLFRMLGPWHGKVVNVARLDKTAVTPLFWRDNRLIIQAGQAVKAMNAFDGAAAWDTGAGQAPQPLTFQETVEGMQILTRQRNLFGRIDIGDGKFLSLGQAEPGRSAAIAVNPDLNTMIIAGADKLTTVGSRNWETELDSACAGVPLVFSRMAVITTADGELRGYALENGALKWRKDLETAELNSLLFAAAEKLFIASERGTFAAWNLDGEREWSVELGDVPGAAPVLTEHGWLLYTRNNRILLLDPENGAVKAQADWPTWIQHLQVLPGALPAQAAVMDLRKRLVLLELPSLKVRQKLQFPFLLAPGIIHAAEFPVSWAGRDEFVRQHNVWLLGDEKGFLYSLILE